MSYLYREDLVPLCIPVRRSMWPFYGLLLGKKKKVIFNLTSQPQGEIQAKSRSSHSDEWSTYNLWSSESGCRAAAQQDDLNLASPVALAHTTWLVELGTSCLERDMCQADVPIQTVLSRMPFLTTHTIQTACKWFSFSGKKCFSCLASQSRRNNFSLVGVCIMSYFGLIVLSPHPAPAIACELRSVK